MSEHMNEPLPCAPMTPDAPASARRREAPVELIATLLLALFTLIAVTAVSIGIARADTAAALADPDVAPFAVALVIALLLAALGGMTALAAIDQPRRGRG